MDFIIHHTVSQRQNVKSQPGTTQSKRQVKSAQPGRSTSTKKYSTQYHNLSLSVTPSYTPKLATYYYTYTTEQGNKKQFAIKKKIGDGETNSQNQTSRPAFSLNSRALLSTIYKDHDEVEIHPQPRKNLPKKFKSFIDKQRSHCQRVQTRLSNKSQQLDASYVDFCVIYVADIAQIYQQQQRYNASGSFYLKEQILELVDDQDQLSRKRQEILNSPQLRATTFTQVSQEKQQASLDKFDRKSDDDQSVVQVDPQTKNKFRQLLFTLDKREKMIKTTRDGPDQRLMQRDVLNAVMLGGDVAQDQIQNHIKKWLDRQHSMLGEMQQHIDDFKSMMKELPESVTQQSPKTSQGRASIIGSGLKGKQLWHLKKDLVRRVGVLSKVLKHADSSGASKVAFSRSQKTQTLHETESIDSFEQTHEKEKKSFILQLLSVDEGLLQAQMQQDTELQRKRNEYWQFDRKGRNLKQLRDKTMKSKLKKYGIIFSRGMKSKFDRMRELLIQCVRKLKMMRITAEEVHINQYRCQLMSDRVILKKPYQREGAYVFFKAVERGDLEIVKLSIKKCRYFIFDVDYVSSLVFIGKNIQTALHICSRKGDPKMAVELLSHGAYPDSLDIAGRTPLYYALINRQNDIARLILYNQGNPWSFKGCDYNLAAQTPEMLKLLKIARRVQYFMDFQLNILLMMTPYVDREKVWLEYREFFMKLGRRQSRQQ